MSDFIRALATNRPAAPNDENFATSSESSRGLIRLSRWSVACLTHSEKANDSDGVLFPSLAFWDLRLSGRSSLGMFVLRDVRLSFGLLALF